MPLLYTIITILLLIFLLRKPVPMFQNHLNYKVSFNDLTTADHRVKQANIQGDFGHLLEELQAQQKINNLTVLDYWDNDESDVNLDKKLVINNLNS